MKNISIKHIKQLESENIFTKNPKIVQGDFLRTEAYQNLDCQFNEIDIFFNYYTNTEMLISKIEQEAKKDCVLVSVSLSKKSVKSQLELIESSALADRNHYLFIYKKIN